MGVWTRIRDWRLHKRQFVQIDAELFRPMQMESSGAPLTVLGACMPRGWRLTSLTLILKIRKAVCKHCVSRRATSVSQHTSKELRQTTAQLDNMFQATCFPQHEANNWGQGGGEAQESGFRFDQLSAHSCLLVGHGGTIMNTIIRWSLLRPPTHEEGLSQHLLPCIE